jgi:hypothetical protein
MEMNKMIKLKELLMEVPVDNYSTIGDFSKGSSYTNPVDRKLITNPVAIQKVKDFFKNTSANFDFYFVNTKDARNHTEVGEVKEDFVYDELNIKPEQLKDGRINRDNITVFFTNNKGAERYPMTAWIMAHRFGHVIRRLYAWEEYTSWVDEQFNVILKSYGYNNVYNSRNYYNNTDYKDKRKYDLAKRNLAETLGTFKSARDKNLREEFEFGYEWFALYLKTGKTPLNPLPPTMVLGHEAFGRKQMYRLRDADDAQQAWNDLTRDGHYYMENVLTECIGKIFVM